MKYRKIDDGFQVVLDRGESLLEVLHEVAEKEKIAGGIINGIGAVENVEIGYFDKAEKSYRKKLFRGEYELLGCSGNFSIKDGKPFAHLHVLLGDGDFRVFGGHLFSAEIAVTGEFFIQTNPEIKRKINPEFNLALWSLS